MTIKLGKAIGSGTADPDAGPAAAASSVPPVSVANKPAPGQKGPKGLAPRTSYSRVNTGTAPVPDAGGSSQKNIPPRGLEFLPRKTAHVEDPMNFQPKPTLQDMLKAAMAGTAAKVDATNLAKEASVQLANQGEGDMAGQPAEQFVSIPTDQVEKLADAVGFISIKVAAEATPSVSVGKGPGALDVMAATSSEENIDAGQMGTATSKHVPPKSPAIQTEQVQQGKANTGLETNDAMSHPEQPTDPLGNEKAKVSAAILQRNLWKIAQLEHFEGKKAPPFKDIPGKGKGNGKLKPKEKDSMMPMGGTMVGNGGGGMTSLASAAPIHLIRKFAEDAINPAQISGGGTHKAAPPPPLASASEESVPPQPSDVTSQAAMVGSNLSAINYTKGQAKADPKKDVNKVLTEPALSSATDKTLQKTLDNTGKAGVKISSVMSDDIVKVAAARALLSKLSADVEAKKKKTKESQGGPDPQSASGFRASGQGGPAPVAGGGGGGIPGGTVV